MFKYDRELKLSNGNTAYYRIVNGMAFEVGMNLKDKEEVEDYTSTVNDSLIDTLLSCYENRNRIRVWYGDTKTGRAWNEEYDIIGRVGRTTGEIKVPILIYNARSYGGSELLLSSLLRIVDIKTHRILWTVPNFHVEKMEVVYKNGDYPFQVMQTRDTGEVVNIANFKNEASAYRYTDLMNGRRYNK
jgi:hypothetical protein